jgi:tetratricopeptide (TPR) repeat protein
MSRVGEPAAWSSRVRGVGILFLASLLGITACVTTPLEDQRWFAVRTAHYDIWSSLGEEETLRLAAEVERFRAATEFLWGHAIGPPPMRTRIYAFDDRGVGRPFTYGNDRSYLLSRLDGDVIVLRTGEGWHGDARVPLKLAYARRLIWSGAGERFPGWYAEGAAQLASTLEIRGRGASVGIPRRDHVQALRDELWIPFDRLLSAVDMARWSDRELALYQAESWAIAHYLRLSDERRNSAAEQIAQFRTQVDRGVAWGEAAREAFGEGLQRAVWKHVQAEVLPSLSVRIQRTGERPSLRVVAQREVVEELGMLAVSIDAGDPARRFLESAQTIGPDSARVLQGLATLLERDGEGAEAEAGFRTALALAPDDPLLRVATGDSLRRRAVDTLETSHRRDLASRARDQYRRAADIAPDLPSAHLGLAASFLVPGEDPAGGIEAARRARQLLPGDATVRLLAARLSLAIDDAKSAREEAHALIVRAGSSDAFEEARSLLREIDAGVAAP